MPFQGAQPLFFLVLLVLAAKGHAQDPSPREQFQAAVAAYQKSATEETAQKLAELFKKLDPPPAIPEKAEYHAQKAVAYAEQAKEPAEFQRAVAEFEKALQLAPWVGEYHYNTALMLKSKGGVSDLEAGMKSVTFARLFAKDDKEKRDATALSAKVEVALELAKERVGKDKKASDQTAADQKAFEGHWIQSTPMKLGGGESVPMSRALFEFDISFDGTGDAKVVKHFKQENSGRWITSPPSVFRGRLVNGELIVNPPELTDGERKRELRLTRAGRGLSYRQTHLAARGAESFSEFEVRR